MQIFCRVNFNWEVKHIYVENVRKNLVVQEYSQTWWIFKENVTLVVRIWNRPQCDCQWQTKSQVMLKQNWKKMYLYGAPSPNMSIQIHQWHDYYRSYLSWLDPFVIPQSVCKRDKQHELLIHFISLKCVPLRENSRVIERVNFPYGPCSQVKSFF